LIRTHFQVPTRPWQGRVKLSFYMGKGVEVKSKGKDMTMGVR
jgi:hypothetical protein